MKLNQLRNNPGAHKAHTRVGRGSSSGLGKTSGRGVKGAKARAGVSIHGFEGGQMPLYMRIPKRGFYNHFGTDFSIVNLGRIQAALDGGRLKSGETITEARLRESGLIGKSRDGVRLLAKGELKTKLNFEVAAASRSAIQAVEKLGGTISMSFKKTVHTNKSGELGKKRKRHAEAADRHA